MIVKYLVQFEIEIEEGNPSYGYQMDAVNLTEPKKGVSKAVLKNALDSIIGDVQDQLGDQAYYKAVDYDVN